MANTISASYVSGALFKIVPLVGLKKYLNVQISSFRILEGLLQSIKWGIISTFKFFITTLPEFLIVTPKFGDGSPILCMPWYAPLNQP